MMIADRCRSFAVCCHAAALHPLVPRHEAMIFAMLACQHETMARELDRVNIMTATGADLDALAVAVFGERLSREEAVRRLATPGGSG